MNWIKVKNIYFNIDHIISVEYRPSVKREDIEVAHISDDGREYDDNGDLIRDYPARITIVTSEKILETISDRINSQAGPVNRVYKFSGDVAENIAFYLDNKIGLVYVSSESTYPNR